MHQFLLAFFAFVFSFGHPAQAHVEQPITQNDSSLYPSISYVPSRREIARGTYLSSYAERTCPSCRTMNVSFEAR